MKAQMPPFFCDSGDHLQAPSVVLPEDLRPVDLDHATARQAADAERDIETERAGGNGLHVDAALVRPEPHDRAFAEVLVDLGQGRFERLLLRPCSPFNHPQHRLIHGSTRYFMQVADRGPKRDSRVAHNDSCFVLRHSMLAVQHRPSNLAVPPSNVGVEETCAALLPRPCLRHDGSASHTGAMPRISRIGLVCGLVGVLARLGGSRRPGTPPPPREPQLRIEPRMHTAPLVRIGVNAACTQLATGSHDKTVHGCGACRKDGSYARCGYRPARATMARSIRWRWPRMAVGWPRAAGDTAARTQRVSFVYIFDTATGAVAARLGPFANVINHLAVSADGSYLAVLVGSEGLRVWERTSADARQWQVLATDRDYGGKMAYGARLRPTRDPLLRSATTAKLQALSGPYGGKPLSVLTKGGSEPRSDRGASLRRSGGRRLCR